MASINKVFILGNLGSDPELRTTGSGKQVCNFTMATQEHKDADPDWHRIVCWERTAELVNQYLSKGSPVHVEGRLTYRTWEDRDGAKRTTAEIVAFRVTFLRADRDESAPRSRTERREEPQRDRWSDRPPANSRTDNNEPETDDIPF